MPVSKTKTILVDVARQLFAKMGVENTTMNDIALASKKGRRTLYTYFKSKEDIYMAVVESELDILLDTMKRVADKSISPDHKILELIYTRLNVVKEVVYRNGTLYPIEIKKTSSPNIKDIKHFKTMADCYQSVNVGEGGVICTYENLLPLGENNKIIPVNFI